MASKAFARLLQIAERSRAGAAGLPSQQEAVTYWSGIGFSMLGRFYVAPMWEVAEVLPVPRCTTVPGVHGWMKGIANIRGRLLPVMDVPGFYQAASSVLDKRRRLLVYDQGEIYSGLMVDEVYGIQHFPVDDYVDSIPDVPAELQTCVQGGYYRGDTPWTIFSLAGVVSDARFMQVARA